MRSDVTRRERPDLDPQFFAALVVATNEQGEQRAASWRALCGQTRELANMGEVWFTRVCTVVDSFYRAHGRMPNLRAIDLGTPYWLDLGLHSSMYNYLLSLRDVEAGRWSRQLLGLPHEFDSRGNLIIDSELHPELEIHNSVIVGSQLGAGVIRDSVILGCKFGNIRANAAFAIGSSARLCELPERSGLYFAVAADLDDSMRAAVHNMQGFSLSLGERGTTIAKADGHHAYVRTFERADHRQHTVYGEPAFGNPLSFADMYAQATSAATPSPAPQPTSQLPNDAPDNPV